MTPQSPVLLGMPDNCTPPEIVLAKDQPEYIPLSVLASRGHRGMMTMRMKLTWRERFQVLCYGNIWLQQLTFHRSLQPIMAFASQPSLYDCLDADESILASHP